MLMRMVWGQLRERPTLTALHIALIGVGTAALLLVSTLLQTVTDAAARDARNIDLVVGPKGSPVQLVLTGVYHIDVPAGNIKVASLDTLRKNPMVASVIPMSLGDSYAGARIVGSTPEFIAHYAATFAEGGVWASEMDVVLGAEVARRTGLAVGMTFESTHGFDAGGSAHDAHAMMVTGILRPTGTVVDRLIVTSLSSVWAAHGLPDDPNKNETSIALLRYASPLAAAALPRAINATTDLQAASPALESARLLTIFGWVADVLRGFAGLVVVVAGVSLFAALTHMLHHRMLDIAVVRALGARRATVLKLLLLETGLIAVCGVLLGLVLVRVAAVVGNRWLPPQAQLALSAPNVFEVMVAFGVVLFALVCVAVPTLRAYRSDASKVLARGR